MVEIFYGIYILISVSFTFLVGQNLYRNGRLFLIDSFHNDEKKADAVNQLLLVGFYLVNFGLVSLFLSIGSKPADSIQAVELLSHKIGIVLVGLGGMHFYNMRNIAKMRSKAMNKVEKAV